MIDLILKVLRAILRSLYLLFEGMPALDALRRWFGTEGAGGIQTTALLLAGAAMVLGAAAFLVFLWFLRRGLLDRQAAATQAGEGGGRPGA